MEKIKETETTKKKQTNDWKPILMELGLHAAKGLIAGFSMKLGGSMFDKTVGRPKANLSLLDGSRRSQAVN